MTDVVSLAEAAGSGVAEVLTSAFLDDPGWRDVGPQREHHRRLVMWGYHRALRHKALRWGRPGYAAFRSGRLVGVAVTFDSEAWPPPEPISTLLDVPAFALAGPPAAVRGWRADAMMKRAHFPDPHMFLWQLAVDPPVQRSGVGRALMARVLADADDAALPIYLETAKPENVPYYRSFGCCTHPRVLPIRALRSCCSTAARRPTSAICCCTGRTSWSWRCGVLGHDLAYWALCGTPPEARTYPEAFDFASWNGA